MPGWAEIVLWTFVSIISLFFVTKMIGKRQMNQMTFFEYIVGIAIGEIGAHMAMHLENKVINSAIALSIYAVFPVVIGWLSLKNKKIREFVNGKARPLVKKGHILTDNLSKERMTQEELLARLRLKDVFSLADVEMALMENDGNISVHLQPENSPLTPQNMESLMTKSGSKDQQNPPAKMQQQQSSMLDSTKNSIASNTDQQLFEIVQQSVHHLIQMLDRNCRQLQVYESLLVDKSIKKQFTTLSTQLENVRTQIQSIEQQVLG